MREAAIRVDNWLASRVESTEKPRSGDAVSHEPSSGEQLGTGGSGKWFSADGRIKQFRDERFRSDEVPDDGVKRVRWSPHEQDTKKFDPNESSVQVSSQEHNPWLRRQPDSTTENLEDAGADDDDMKALGAVDEEPVITIGA